MNRQEIHNYKENYLPYQIVKLKLLMGKLFTRLLKIYDIDLSPEQAQILGLLMEKGNLCMNAISNDLCIDNSAVTRLIDVLEQKQFVQRTISKEDRRMRVITITSKGKKEILRTFELSKNNKEILLQNIEKADESKLIEMMKKMQNNIIEQLKRIEN